MEIEIVATISYSCPCNGVGRGRQLEIPTLAPLGLRCVGTVLKSTFAGCFCSLFTNAFHTFRASRWLSHFLPFKSPLLTLCTVYKHAGGRNFEYNLSLQGPLVEKVLGSYPLRIYSTMSGPNKLVRHYTLCPPKFWKYSTNPKRAEKEWKIMTTKTASKTPSVSASASASASASPKARKKKAPPATLPAPKARPKGRKKKAASK